MSLSQEQFAALCNLMCEYARGAVLEDRDVIGMNANPQVQKAKELARTMLVREE